MKHQAAKHRTETAPGQRLTRAALSRLLGVSRPAITKAVKVGRLEVDEAGTIDVEAAIEAFATSDAAAGNGVTHDEAMRELRRQFLRARVAEVEARQMLAEIEIGKQKGQLVDADDVVNTWSRQVGQCRALLLAGPTKLAPRLIVMKTQDAIAAELKRWIHEALEALAADGRKRRRDA